MSTKVFPVIYSTLDRQALSTLMQMEYDIGVITNCQLWRRGLSDVYLVETLDNNFIFRITNCFWRCRLEIDFELDLLNFLHFHQIPVAYPLRTESGNLTLSINAPEGERFGVLFIYAPGEIPIGDLNETQSYRLGEMLARIHLVGFDFHSNFTRQILNLEYLLEDSVKTIAPFLKKRTRELDYLLDLTDRIEGELQPLPQQKPFWTICWGDPHSGNAHFTPENQVTLFDFDQCGYGWRSFDIGKFLQVSLRTGLSPNVRKAFFRGYLSICPLTDLEKSLLQAWVQVAHIWMWAINLNAARQYDWCRLDESYFSHRLEQLKSIKTRDWQPF